MLKIYFSPIKKEKISEIEKDKFLYNAKLPKYPAVTYCITKRKPPLTARARLSPTIPHTNWWSSNNYSLYSKGIRTWEKYSQTPTPPLMAFQIPSKSPLNSSSKWNLTLHNSKHKTCPLISTITTIKAFYNVSQYPWILNKSIIECGIFHSVHQTLSWKLCKITQKLCNRMNDQRKKKDKRQTNMDRTTTHFSQNNHFLYDFTILMLQGNLQNTFRRWSWKQNFINLLDTKKQGLNTDI